MSRFISLLPKRNCWLLIALGLLLALPVGCDSNSDDDDYEQASLGGSNWDYFTRHGARSISRTSDGGYVLTGSTSSKDGDLAECKGVFDMWVAKLSSDLKLMWQVDLGGSAAERSASVIETSDGGYLAAGSTYSKDGDVTGYKGKGDAWVVKLDSTGNVEWKKCFGGKNWDEASAIVELDEGYAIAGYSNSRDGDKSGAFGVVDGWIFMIDSQGDYLWDRVVGGEGQDFIHCMERTADGGLIAVGYSLSQKGHLAGSSKGVNIMAAKLHKNGTLDWVNAYGSDGNEYGTAIKQAADGGFVVTGVAGTEARDLDALVMKIDSQGNEIWSKYYGGSASDSAFGLVLDGGDIYFTGESYSDDGDFPGNKGKCDLILARLDTEGNLKKARRLGGGEKDSGGSILRISGDGDKKFLVTGWTGSDDGDVKFNHGGVDIWLVKVTENLGS